MATTVYKVLKPRTLHSEPDKEAKTVKESKPVENAELPAVEHRWVGGALWVKFEKGWHAEYNSKGAAQLEKVSGPALPKPETDSDSNSGSDSDSEPEDPDLASEDEDAGPPSILDRVEDALDHSCQDLAQITKAIDDAEADGCTHPAFKALLEKRDQLVEDKGESEEEEDALPSAKAKSKPGSALAPRISACALTRLVLLQRCRRRNRQPTDATLWLPCRQGTRIFLASALSK